MNNSQQYRPLPFVDRGKHRRGDAVEGPSRILMSVDAVGGVWRYAMDLAEQFRLHGIETIFAGFGPPPSEAQSLEAGKIGVLMWSDLPLDWMVDDEHQLRAVPDFLKQSAAEYGIDLLHLNLPSQAVGLDINLPVVVVSHSCVVTWFEAVHGCAVPARWLWQDRRNRTGFDRADAVLAPSRSHAQALQRCYGPIANLALVFNASKHEPVPSAKEDFVFAAGRWWDEGKNARLLDEAARESSWTVIMAGATDGPAGQHVHLHHALRLGEVSHGHVMALMARAAIVASPSLYEPFGLAVLEAAHAGAALVLADIPTYRELWSDAALFADARDAGRFCDAINRLADDESARLELATCAKRRAQSFSAERQCLRLLDVYRRAMRRSCKLTAAG
ncbi:MULTISPECIES: glycosyltransferase family 4 protein [unclassified Sinorhizobium]|uniref:glycosyltransferase family 4 protein n=1 Tax=unclassified Sinorhizobium TaxID=2613772 RepID=UPI003526BFBE